jgi:hypothetical protein
VRGVGLERDGLRRRGAPVQEPGDEEVDDDRCRHHGDAEAQVRDLRADHEVADGLERDHAGAHEDQDALDHRGEVLDLLVAVGMRGVGGLVGLAHGDERHDRRDQVDRGVHRLGEQGDRPGDRARDDLDQDQAAVGRDRQRRRARLGRLL